MGARGAYCVHSLSSKNPQSLSKDEWDAARVGQICASPEAIGDMKAVIEKLCHESKDCRYDTD